LLLLIKSWVKESEVVDFVTSVGIQ